MRGFYAYLKKELLEQIVTFKTLIICLLFFLLGVISPIGAKYASEVISVLTKDSIQIQIAEPTYLDAYVQFFKNISQLGVIVFVIIYCNILGQELMKGTLIIPISKGLTLQSVINAKFCALVCSWTTALMISFLSCLLYTQIIFKENYLSGVALLLFGIWLFGIFLIALIICTNVICKGGYISLLVVVGGIGILLLLNIVPDLREYNPLYLVNVDVAGALTMKVYNMAKSGIVTITTIVAMLVVSNILIRSKGEYCN